MSFSFIISLAQIFDSEQNLVDMHQISNNVLYNKETNRFEEVLADQPFISVVIPVFNTGKFIEKCLKSAMEQTFNSFEVIIVNDATIDDAITKAKALI